MITKEQIKIGLDSGVVKLVVDPMEHGTVCQIGENWFYFGGLTAEEMSPDEYRRDIPQETIVDEIFSVLNDFRERPEFIDEYRYYDAMLSESIPKPNVKSLLSINFFDDVDKETYTCTQYLILVLGNFETESLQDSFASFAESDLSALPYHEWVKRVLDAEHYDWKYILPNQKIPACDRFESLFI